MRVTIGFIRLLIQHFDSGSFCAQFTCLLVFSFLNVKCLCDQCDFVQNYSLSRKQKLK